MQKKEIKKKKKQEEKFPNGDHTKGSRRTNKTNKKICR